MKKRTPRTHRALVNSIRVETVPIFLKKQSSRMNDQQYWTIVILDILLNNDAGQQTISINGRVLLFSFAHRHCTSATKQAGLSSHLIQKVILPTTFVQKKKVIPGHCSPSYSLLFHQFFLLDRVHHHSMHLPIRHINTHAIR